MSEPSGSGLPPLAPVLGLQVRSLMPSFPVDAGNLNSGSLAYSSEHITHLVLPLVPEETCSNGLPTLGAGLSRLKDVIEAIPSHWLHDRTSPLVPCTLPGRAAPIPHSTLDPEQLM